MTTLRDLRPLVKKAAIHSGMLRLAAKTRPRRIAVLRYHSVLPEPQKFGGSIGAAIIHSSKVFAEQMELIASKYRPISLDQLCTFLDGGLDLPHGAVVVTFDDGFADNLEVAAPILARCGVPAAFYLAVDYIGNRRQPWYVRLRNAFSVSQIPVFTTSQGIRFQMTNEEQRRQAFLNSSRACAKLCGNSQEDLLSQIELALEVEAFSIPTMLSWQGARELIHQGHIVGSHTLSHPNVAYIDARQLTDELVISKSEIERQTGSRVVHFSYPAPILEPHFSDESVAATREAGYRSAVTALAGTVIQGDNKLTLKRVYAMRTLSEFEWSLENSLVGRVV